VEMLMKKGIEFVVENYLDPIKKAELQKYTGTKGVWRVTEKKESKYDPHIYF
jgi:arsenate reductase-like glutaredoxin family protein